MLAMAVQKRSILTLLAEDGQQGIEAVEAHPGAIDLIFMDNTMPIKVRLGAPTTYFFLMC